MKPRSVTLSITGSLGGKSHALRTINQSINHRRLGGQKSHALGTINQSINHRKLGGAEVARPAHNQSTTGNLGGQKSHDLLT